MTAPEIIRPSGQSLAVVIFGDSTIPYLRRLKPGYRHCMAATQSGGEWHLLDPLSNGMEITRLGLVHPEEVIRTFHAGGFDAFSVQRRGPVAREMPWSPFTCVEAVKRVLGLHARWILTPWQLRRALDAYNPVEGQCDTIWG